MVCPNNDQVSLGLSWVNMLLLQIYPWLGIIAAPLTVLLKKNSFHWTPVAIAAFLRLKDAVTSPPVFACRIFPKLSP